MQGRLFINSVNQQYLNRHVCPIISNKPLLMTVKEISYIVCCRFHLLDTHFLYQGLFFIMCIESICHNELQQKLIKSLGQAEIIECAFLLIRTSRTVY